MSFTHFTYPLSKNTHLLQVKIENYFHACGFYNVRARIHNDLVRLEIDQDAFMKCMDYRQEIVLFIKELGYDYVTLDLEGFRSGSQDIKLEEK